MIHEVFQALNDGLTAHLRLGWSGSTTLATEPVVFFRSNKLEIVDFTLGAVTMMIVSIEEDRRALPAEPYRRTLPDGTLQLVKAPVPLHLYVLFAARFDDYLDSLQSVSLIVRFFQKHRVIDHASMPALSDKIEKLTCELVTIPITERNQVWEMLNTAYQPSLLYKIRMVVFHDDDGIPAAPPGTPIIKINT
jgi:hypothetical protein